MSVGWLLVNPVSFLQSLPELHIELCLCVRLVTNLKIRTLLALALEVSAAFPPVLLVVQGVWWFRARSQLDRWFASSSIFALLPRC
jgi:hypothetical protein